MMIRKRINMYDNDDTRGMLERIRAMRERASLTEFDDGYNPGMIFEGEENKKMKSIAITDDPKFGQNVLSSQIQEFRTSVESGAQFSKANEDKVSESPLIYLPDSGNLVFSGIIPCLNNLKFQFVLKTSTGNGCFLWGDGFILNKDNMQILNKLYGFYLNWRESWNAEAGDLERMVNNLED